MVHDKIYYGSSHWACLSGVLFYSGSNMSLGWVYVWKHLT